MLAQKGYPCHIWRLTEVFREEKPDIVISFIETTNLITVLSRILSRIKPRLFLAAYMHTSIALKQRLFGRIVSKLIPFLYRQCEVVVCCSRGVANDLTTNFMVPPHKIRIIHGSVDIEHVSELAREEVKHPYFTPKDQPIIMAIGRLVAAKGYPY